MEDLMNITSIFENRGKFNPDALKSFEEGMKSIGYESVRREIILFIKENKNTHGIAGNNIVTNVGCLIVNYSIYNAKNKRGRVFDKTVYLCDVEFPLALSAEAIRTSIEPFLEMATVNPTYAYSTRHVEIGEEFINLGLTLVDLSVDTDGFGVLNFTDATQESVAKFKEFVFENGYNPKHYSIKESRLKGSYADDSRSGLLRDFVDGNTKIIYNRSGEMSLETFDGYNKTEGIYIDKRTITIGEYMTSMFNKFMFLPFDLLEFVYNTTISSLLNITKLATFSRFNDLANDSYIESLMTDINTAMRNLRETLGEDFYIITNINKHFMYVTMTFFRDNKEIRIKKPLSMMYAEFSLDCELFADEVDTTAEMVKTDMIEHSCREAIECLDFTRNIAGAIELVDQATQKIKMKLLENQSKIESMIGNNVRGRVNWDVREKYLNSPNH